MMRIQSIEGIAKAGLFSIETIAEDGAAARSRSALRRDMNACLYFDTRLAVKLCILNVSYSEIVVFRA